MSETNLYERIVTPQMVEQAMVGTLDVWINDYLGEMERLEGYVPDAIERPRGIVTSSEFDKWPEDQLPCILVMNLGLAEKPVRRGRGAHEATWLVGVVPIVSDTNEGDTRQLSSAYTAACRSAVLQHKMLKSALHPDGFASGLQWADEKYGDIPFPQTRTIASGHVIFRVGVEGVVTEQAGPREPSPEPSHDPGQWPTATQITVKTDPVALSGALP